MRAIFLILAILITAFVVFFAQYNEIALNLGLMYSTLSFKTTFFTITICTFCLGILTGVLLMLKGIYEGAKENKKIRRQLEKADIGADDSELKVKTLQNKVQTLEIALKKALEEK